MRPTLVGRLGEGRDARRSTRRRSRSRRSWRPRSAGRPTWRKVEKIDLERIPEAFRLQRLTFLAARKAFEDLGERFTGRKELLVFQLIRLVEAVLRVDRVCRFRSLFHQDPLRRRILISLSIDRVVQHLLRFVTEQNLERIEPVFDEEFPIGSTRNMRTWYTTKVCHPTVRSQISHMVADSAWEQHAANILETSPLVERVRQERAPRLPGLLHRGTAPGAATSRTS